MKKRKKRRSKTEGGDKLPFDDEMGKNQKAIKVLQRLFDAGYGTEKEIVNMAMDEMLALPGVNVADLCIISELQKSIKANKVISYLSEETEVKEETKGADYGGTINASLVIPREVFKSSILANASAIIGLHNHPSGNVKPSKEDMIVTRKLQKCGQLLGIELLDHIIVGGTNGKMLSFREEKMLNVTGRMDRER